MYKILVLTKMLPDAVKIKSHFTIKVKGYPRIAPESGGPLKIFLTFFLISSPFSTHLLPEREKHAWDGDIIFLNQETWVYSPLNLPSFLQCRPSYLQNLSINTIILLQNYWFWSPSFSISSLICTGYRWRVPFNMQVII